MTDSRKGPVLIDLDDDMPAARPGEAEPVLDLPDMAGPTAMQQVMALGARKPSRLAGWFWSILGSLVTFVATLAAWDYVNGLFSRNPILGYIALILVILFVLVLTIIALKELAAFARLRRLDDIHKAATTAHATGDLKGARAVIARLEKLYANRPDTAWARDKMRDQGADIFDADGLLGHAELTLLAPLDQRAQREVEAAARQVATVTAVVPLALADVFTALTSNLRMIRRIAEVYGGRAGTLGSWRLTRTVLAHLVATGAVAVGDDLIHSVAGGGLLSKLSRRFGEGVINGALTARVGVAAIEVCRPLPFVATKRPSVTTLVQRALTGLFGTRE